MARRWSLLHSRAAHVLPLLLPLIVGKLTAMNTSNSSQQTQYNLASSDFYVRQILHQFGDGETLTVSQLTQLLAALGVDRNLHHHIDHSNHSDHHHIDHDHSNHHHIDHSNHSNHHHIDHDHSDHHHIDHDHSDHHHIDHSNHSDHHHIDHDHSNHHHIDHSNHSDHDHTLSEDQTVKNRSSRSTPTDQVDDVLLSKAAMENLRVRRDVNGVSAVINQCPDVYQLLNASANASAVLDNISISAQQLHQLSPALVYFASNRHHCHLVSDTESSKADHDAAAVQSPTVKLWLCAFAAVFAISICGLFGVLAAPIIQQHFYRRLLNFLVALAVGTLAGDALLHLIPHALLPHDDHHHDHHHHGDDGTGDHSLQTAAVMKGLAALLALLVFFVSERLLAILQGFCSGKRRKHINHHLADVSGLSVEQTQMIERKMKTYGKTPGASRCLSHTDTSAFLASVNSEERSCAGVESRVSNVTSADSDHHGQLSPATAELENGKSQTVVASKEESGKGATSPSHVPAKSQAASAKDSSDTSGVCRQFVSQSRCDQPPSTNHDSFTVIIHEHEHRHHGHTHTHGHVHRSGAAQTPAAAAMVILGDGLHNFTDGLAIGAAFAAGGVAGGLSTSVAVFCHELPHEIGDFAVLLKVGMSVRVAVFYNMVSSVLCLLGMIFGMMLGTIHAFNSWVFAFAAGSFLYIALVDMVPELSLENVSADTQQSASTHDQQQQHSAAAASGVSTSAALLELSIQVVGLFCGAGIMMAIAVYEHSLHTLFDFL